MRRVEGERSEEVIDGAVELRVEVRRAAGRSERRFRRGGVLGIFRIFRRFRMERFQRRFRVDAEFRQRFQSSERVGRLRGAAEKRVGFGGRERENSGASRA